MESTHKTSLENIEINKKNKMNHNILNENDSRMNNNNAISDSVNVNEEMQDTGAAVKFVSSNAGDSDEDPKISDSIPDKNIENRKVLDNSSDVNITDRIATEHKQLIENQETKIYQEIKKSDVNLDKSNLSKFKDDDTDKYDHECFANPDIGQNRSEYLEFRAENFKLTENVEKESETACNASLKIDNKENNLDLSLGNIKDLTSDENLSKEKIECTTQEMMNTGKTEHLGIMSQSENLGSNDSEKNIQESYIKDRTSKEESTSELDGKFTINFLNNNLDLKNINIKQDLDMTDEDTTCGYGCFKPKWIQKYATPRSYLILFSIIGIIHGCYYSYVVSIISTLEKRYSFKTKVSGTLLLADEITPLILGILVGYVGGKTHRPRMVALGMFLSATCCFVSGLPYLIYGTSKNNLYSEDKYKTGQKLCEVGSNNSHCNIDEQPPTLSVVGIFLFASFLKGFATLSYYVIGISYMDDIIKRKNSPMYLAIALALRLLGPLVGFLMSSGFLKYYENPVYDPGFGPDDPRWIGAWWIGFFLQGILLMIFTIPIALFPRRLPSQKKLEKLATATEEGIKEMFRGLVSALKRLGKNPVFIILIFKATMKIFGQFGHAISLPKYMEHQFKLSASEASLYSGALSISCIIISTLLGGFLIWKFRPRTKVLLAGMIVSELMLSIGFVILMIPKCNSSEMLHFGMNEEGLILNSVCNQNCDCSTSTFTPFCGQDGKTLYFSPCYAGCTDDVTLSSTSKAIKEFGNCSCVADQQFGTTISEGFCPDDNCRSQTIAYLVILFIMMSITNLFTVASTMILLRSVHPNDKTVALGTFETFICLLGFIPFPVTYGALVDSACLVWEKSCGETGNCWFYDMEKYNYLLHGASALFSALCLVCLVILYFFSSRIRDLYDEEDEVQEDKSIDAIKLDTVYGSVTKL